MTEHRQYDDETEVAPGKWERRRPWIGFWICFASAAAVVALVALIGAAMVAP